jgi:L-asparaginase
VNGVPQTNQFATVKVDQIVKCGSPDITTENWLTIANRLSAICADPAVAAVVVAHGTRTLEETAYFLNLTFEDDRPVVLVGSMRPSTAISADGPLNLLNAIRTAIAGGEGRGRPDRLERRDQQRTRRHEDQYRSHRHLSVAGARLRH